MDEKGWEDMNDLLSETLDRAMQIQADSACRVAKGEGDTFSATMVMMSYPTPKLREGEHRAELGHEEEAELEEEGNREGLTDTRAGG